MYANKCVILNIDRYIAILKTILKILSTTEREREREREREKKRDRDRDGET